MNWLKRFLAPKVTAVKTVVVTDEPVWTANDAQLLDAFLKTDTGLRLIGRMHHQIHMLCMSEEPMTVAEQAERRAMRMVVCGIEGHADFQHFQRLDAIRAAELARAADEADA